MELCTTCGSKPPAEDGPHGREWRATIFRASPALAMLTDGLRSSLWAQTMSLMIFGSSIPEGLGAIGRVSAEKRELAADINFAPSRVRQHGQPDAKTNDRSHDPPKYLE